MNYLYNGVELPALPEWDKETYPYAVITPMFATTDPNKGAKLYVYSAPLYHAEGELTTATACKRMIALWSYLSHPEYGWYKYTSTTEIGFTDPEDMEAGDIIARSAVWTNTDILNEDGSIYLAASDPVPVSALDPQSLTAGWLVGKKIAAMRK